MQKNRYIYKNIETILSNKFLRIFIIVSLLIFGYFCSTLDRSTNYFEALSHALTYQQFLTLCLLPMVILADVLVIDLFEKNLMSIIRFKNKKQYIKELIKTVFFTTSFLFILIILITLTFFNFFSSGDLSIAYIEGFKTTNIIYALYTIIKLYILIVLTSIMFTFLFKIFNKIGALAIAVLVTCSLFIVQGVDSSIVSSICQMPLYFGIYFLDIISYKSFGMNLLSFGIITFVLLLFIYLLYCIVMIFKKDIVSL